MLRRVVLGLVLFVLPGCLGSWAPPHVETPLAPLLPVIPRVPATWPVEAPTWVVGQSWTWRVHDDQHVSMTIMRPLQEGMLVGAFRGTSQTADTYVAFSPTLNATHVYGKFPDQGGCDTPPAYERSAKSEDVFQGMARFPLVKGDVQRTFLTSMPAQPGPIWFAPPGGIVLETRVGDYENVTTPVGVFDAVRLEMRQWVNATDDPTLVTEAEAQAAAPVVAYYAPAIGAVVRAEGHGLFTSLGAGLHRPWMELQHKFRMPPDTIELTGFSLAQRAPSTAREENMAILGPQRQYVCNG